MGLFINLAKWLWRYLNFSALNKSNFDGIFWRFLGLKSHNFTKNDPNFENKGFFYAELNIKKKKKKFKPKTLKTGVLDLTNSFGIIGLKRLIKPKPRTVAPIFIPFIHSNFRLFCKVQFCKLTNFVSVWIVYERFVV